MTATGGGMGFRRLEHQLGGLEPSRDKFLGVESRPKDGGWRKTEGIALVVGDEL